MSWYRRRATASRTPRHPRLVRISLALVGVLAGPVAVPALTGSAVASATTTGDGGGGVPVLSLTTVSATFYPNPGNNGGFDSSQLANPAFTQQFPEIDFNPPASAQVNCSNSVGVDEFTRPFTDVVQNVDGSCSADVAEGNNQQAGVGNLYQFEAVLTAPLSVNQPGQATFNFFSDDGWILGIGPREGGTEQPTYVSGEMLNPPPSTPVKGYPVVGSYNIPSSPNQVQVTVNFPAAGTYPIEVDYTECCGGQLALTMGSTYGNPIPPALSTRTIEFVHGINGNFHNFECNNLTGGFAATLAQICANASFEPDSFPYYQDMGYATSSGGPCAGMPAPDVDTGILAVDPNSIDPNICDSKGALAYSAAALDKHLASLAGNPVTVIANSMGGAIARGWLADAYDNGPGDASLNAADSVIFLQGAQAGSWAAAFGQILNSDPRLSPFVSELSHLIHLDVNRPGVIDVTPLSAWYGSVNPSVPSPGVPPQLAYYNFYSNLKLNLQINFGLFTLSEGSFDAGDLVMLPGSDNPNAQPLLGGERFLPGGSQTTNRHQFAMNDQVNINPLDFALPELLARDVTRILASPVTHFHFPSHDKSIQVTSCGTGGPTVSASSEIVRILESPQEGCGS